MTRDPARPAGRVCGVTISAMPLADAARAIVAAATNRARLEVHLCNAYTLSLVDRDEQLRAALQQADLNLPDGAPVAWLLRRHGARGPVRGPALVPAVATLGAANGLRHYLWGGEQGVAEGVADRLRSLDPAITIAGCETPSYDELEDDDLQALAARIRAAEAHVLWVGLGTPRQDHLVHRLGPLLKCPVVPVGAAFDFLAGRVSEAPSWLHGSGFEWLYRLAREPRRLWRRYLLGNPRFVLSAVRHATGRAST